MAKPTTPPTKTKKKKTKRRAGAHPAYWAALCGVVLAAGFGLGVVSDRFLEDETPKVSRSADVRDMGQGRTSPVIRNRTVDRDPGSILQPSRSMETQIRIAPSYERFAADAPADDGRPWIAIVIDDLGPDVTRTDAIIRLPGPLTLSFLTYANDLQTWSERAREAGHEVFGHVPMQPHDPTANPGPGALMTGSSASRIKSQMEAYLGAWTGYVGINNHMGSKLTEDDEIMQVVMGELKDRGLMWLDSVTSADTRGSAQAKLLGIPYAERDIFLDNDPTEQAVSAQLAKAEALARETGRAIAIAHPKDGTIAALKAWLPTLDAKGFALAPVSAMSRPES